MRWDANRLARLRAEAARIPLADGSAHCVVTSPPYLTPRRTCASIRGVKRRSDGTFRRGVHYSPATEFKPGQHWRPRKPFWSARWLRREYVTRERSAGDIARQFGVHDEAILHWLRRHGIERRTVSQARAVKHWGATGADNPMYGKRDSLAPRWTGRWPKQRPNGRSEYVAWRAAVIARVGRFCTSCGGGPIHRARDLHVHHIRSWREHPDLRFEPMNGTVMCASCHSRTHNLDRLRGRFPGGKEVRT